MQKKLLALAIAGALCAPLAAQAQNVKIYGLVQPSIDIISDGDDRGTTINDNNSRLGFSGSEDLGGGLKAIFQMEHRLEFDQRTGEITNRDSWVGLAGGFGSVTIGNHQSAYVRSTAALDPFADTIGDYNNIMATLAAGADIFNTRWTNSIYYTSPNFGGFQVLASYSLNEREGPAAPDRKDDDVLSIAASWTAGAFSVIGAYERQSGLGGALFTGDVDDDGQAFKLGASFKVLPTTTLYAMAERIDIDGDVAGDDFDDRDAYYFGVKHSMGSVDLLGSFIVARDSGLGDDGAKNLNLGAVYNFSKRTNVGVYYAHVKNDEDVGTEGLGGYGMDSGYAPETDEDTVNGFSVRLRHSF